MPHARTDDGVNLYQRIGMYCASAGKVDKETAAFLQRVAEQTVRRFFGR